MKKTTTANKCRHCGKPLPIVHRTGPKPKYCDATCRYDWWLAQKHERYVSGSKHDYYVKNKTRIMDRYFARRYGPRAAQAKKTYEHNAERPWTS